MWDEKKEDDAEVDDEIMAEVRRVRDEYAASFNHDLNLMYQDLKRIEKESGLEFITRSPRLVERVEAKQERRRKIS